MDFTNFELFIDAIPARICNTSLHVQKTLWQKLNQPERVYIYFNDKARKMLIKRCDDNGKGAFRIHVGGTTKSKEVFRRILSSNLTNKIRQLASTDENSFKLKGYWNDKYEDVEFDLA